MIALAHDSRHVRAQRQTIEEQLTVLLPVNVDPNVTLCGRIPISIGSHVGDMRIQSVTIGFDGSSSCIAASFRLPADLVVDSQDLLRILAWHLGAV